MILASNFWINIRDFIVDKIANISFGDIAGFIVGIIFGFILFALIYLILVLASFKRKEPVVYKNQAEVDDEEIKKIIDDCAKGFKEQCHSKPVGEKMEALKPTATTLIGDIAKKYYPTSPHPVAELSIDETILLFGYITKRVDELLNVKGIKYFRKYRISKVLSMIDTKKRIEETKVVKAAKRAQLPKIASVGWAVLNAINPVYWVKKLIINPTFSATANKLLDIIIRIVGEETAKVYSKSIFNNDQEIDMMINELDKEYEE